MFHIVDDHSCIGEMLSELLEDLGHASLVFSCPQEYIHYVNSSDYKAPIATFTDISMPGMTGYDMIGILSKKNPAKKFIVMTSEPEIEHRHKGRGCIYLVKPFNFERLYEAVNTLTRCSRSGPGEGFRCETLGDHPCFAIDEWKCPHHPENAD